LAAGEFGQYGPYDYYKPDEAPREALPLVERAHFSPSTCFVLAIRGEWCYYWSQVDYTLRAFPNHPRALVRMADYLKTNHACKDFGRRSNDPNYLAWQLGKGDWEERTVEYYFDTAISFRPQYAETRLIYVEALMALKRPQEAEKAMADAKKAAELGPAYERLIRIFTRARELDFLRRLAGLAQSTGTLTPALRDKFIAAKAWPPEDPAAPASAVGK